MTSVRDIARISHDIEGVHANIPSPSDDYRAAARLVWLRCVVEARETGESYDDGWLRKGAMMTVVTMLWPTLGDTQARNASRKITKLLQASNNALLLNREYGPGKASTWYISEEWRTIPDDALTVPRPRKPQPQPEPSAEVVQAEQVEDPQWAPMTAEQQRKAFGEPEPAEPEPVRRVRRKPMEPVTPEPDVVSDLLAANEELRAQLAERDQKIDKMRRHLGYLLDRLEA